MARKSEMALTPMPLLRMQESSFSGFPCGFMGWEIKPAEIKGVSDIYVLHGSMARKK
jgi:hypothetical protein